MSALLQRTGVTYPARGMQDPRQNRKWMKLGGLTLSKGGIRNVAFIQCSSFCVGLLPLGGPICLGILNGHEAADEIRTRLDGRYGRAFVLDDGRIVIHTGTLQPDQDPTRPAVFVADDTFGFAPSNAGASLSVVIDGKDKYLDVDGAKLSSVSGSSKDVSVIKLSGNPEDSDTASVVEIAGRLTVTVLQNSAVRIRVHNSDSGTSLTFGLSPNGLQFEAIGTGNESETGFCCEAVCPGGTVRTGTNCILCTCWCGLLGEPWAVCWIFRIIGVLEAV